MKISRDGQLGYHENQRVHRFLDIFSEIENLLKTRLRKPLGDKTAVKQLIEECEQQDPYWKSDAHDLEHFRQVRNFLTHERMQEHGYSVLVTRRSLERLIAVRHKLRSPVPISRKHKKKVVSVTSGDDLASVLALAYQKLFSQFPVVDSAKFKGLITENEITRWFGRQVINSRTAIDVRQVEVRAVLREKEQSRKDAPIFRFESLDAPETEVMGLFVTRPMLEVVLLTETGNANSGIDGIVTQWDAAQLSPT